MDISSRIKFYSFIVVLSLVHVGRKSFLLNRPTFAICVQLSVHTGCLHANRHAGKPASDQLLQPMPASIDQCVLAGPNIACVGTAIRQFFFSFSPLW